MTLSASKRALREITAHPLNRDRRIGAVIDYFRWNLSRRLMPGEVIVSLADDATVIVTTQQNFGTLAYTCGLWDFEEMVFLTHLLRPADLFLDIGANVGGYTILASAVAAARSLAFEPVPATFAGLQRNIRLNAIEDRARAMQVGVGDIEQTVSMTADRGGLNHVVQQSWPGATVSVPVRRIDDLLAGEPCRLVKLDTEGFELKALRGGKHTFADPTLLALIVELNGSGDRYGNPDEAVHAEIMQFGFAPYRYDPVGRVLSPLQTFNRNSLNTIYVRDADQAADLVQAGRQIQVRGRRF